tara:strand:+ start:11845 stop:11982 length:138 start_codon:yes stop_codon:yes gene_type:complete
MSISDYILFSLAIFRHSGLRQLAVLWVDFPDLPAAYAIDEQKQKK